MNKRRIVLAAVGSLGDLHPFVSVAKRLDERDATPIMAVGEDHLEKCKLAGLEAEAVLRSFEKGSDSSDADEILNQILSKRQDLLNMLVSSVGDTLDPLVRIASGADAIVGSSFTFAAPLAAEILKIPFIFGVLQPMSWFSWADPPIVGGFEALFKPAHTKAGQAWNRFVGTIISAELRRRYAGSINQVRLENGLIKSDLPPILRPGTRPALSIGLYSDVLSPLPPDAPQPAKVVGFPWFDSEDGREPRIASEVERFLTGHPPPLVISFGSFVHRAAGDLIEHTVNQALGIGLRVLVLSDRELKLNHPDVLVWPYVPHSLVFSKAAAIIHHGGVGTLGQALRAGKPQVVIPFFGDQFDNARRLERTGAGISVSPRQFRRKARSLLLNVTTDQRMSDIASDISTKLAFEDGAGAAADLILATLELLGET